mgnify:CR=1 FL=1
MQMLSLLLAGTMVSTTVLPPASVLAAEENGIVAEEGIEGPENDLHRKSRGMLRLTDWSFRKKRALVYRRKQTRNNSTIMIYR